MGVRLNTSIKFTHPHGPSMYISSHSVKGERPLLSLKATQKDDVCGKVDPPCSVLSPTERYAPSKTACRSL